ncbi:MAG: hypothetical protein ACR2GZ_11810 [Solirubrobacteraceae bacterium]
MAIPSRRPIAGSGIIVSSMAYPKTPASDESAHDVLAAEEFGVPASDPVLHHGPVRLPEDPSGIVEAHDVLAAEEFALPAPRAGLGLRSGKSGKSASSRGAWAAAGALVLLALRRRSRRRHRRT